MPKHISRLIGLLILFLVLAISLKSYFTADSFYQFGHYRAASVLDIAAKAPKFRTPVYCQECHTQRFETWRANNHKTVICEVCHGAAEKHPEQKTITIPKDTQKLCSLCHEAMAGRPQAQPQVDIEKHADGQQCVVCHNPHSPKIGSTLTQQSTTHGDAKKGEKLSTQCVSCHGIDGVSHNPEWPNLVGQNRGYVANALASFKDGRRNNLIMTPIAQTLSSVDIDDLAAYYAMLVCSKEGVINSATKAKFQTLPQSAQCNNCHGENGISSNPAWPNLAQQNEQYLVRALNDFKQGLRQDSIMTPLAKKLSQQDIHQLASYYHSLEISNNCSELVLNYKK